MDIARLFAFLHILHPLEISGSTRNKNSFACISCQSVHSGFRKLTLDVLEHQSVQPKGYSQGTHEDPSMSPSTQKSELDSRSLSQTQYLSLSNTSPSQGVQSKPFMSPTISELPVSSPTESIAGNTLNEGSRSPPTEWNEQRPPSHVSSSLPETDMHGFLISAPGPGPATPQLARSSWLEQQQKQVKEEKARLTRLQELSEMEARLEEQLQRELAEERRS